MPLPQEVRDLQDLAREREIAQRVLPFPAEEYAERLRRLRAALTEAGIDTLLLSRPESMYWLSGYGRAGTVTAGPRSGPGSSPSQCVPTTTPSTASTSPAKRTWSRSRSCARTSASCRRTRGRLRCSWMSCGPAAWRAASSRGDAVLSARPPHGDGAGRGDPWAGRHGGRWPPTSSIASSTSNRRPRSRSSRRRCASVTSACAPPSAPWPRGSPSSRCGPR